MKLLRIGDTYINLDKMNSASVHYAGDGKKVTIFFQPITTREAGNGRVEVGYASEEFYNEEAEALASYLYQHSERIS